MPSVKVDYIEQLKKRVANGRTAIANRLLAGDSTDELSSAFITLAVREGELYAAMHIRRALEFTNPEPYATNHGRQAMDECVRLLSVPAKSDTYSGRSNDIMRAFNDGVRDVAGSAARCTDFGKFAL